jgi:YfiH family protein
VIPPGDVESVPQFSAFGVRAFTTTRAVGSFGTGSTEPVKEVMGRWDALRATLAADGGRRLATAAQVHGDRVVEHAPGWEGWLRGPQADGHIAPERGTAVAVTIADCVPVFIAHPSGVVAALHSGWRGTAARIVERAIAQLGARGLKPPELQIHLGPAVCGRCYEVSPEVIQTLTGKLVERPQPVDLRGLIADHARAAGVRQISTSASCTRHNNDRFFSHRAGDPGRQVAVILAIG